MNKFKPIGKLMFAFLVLIIIALMQLFYKHPILVIIIVIGIILTIIAMVCHSYFKEKEKDRSTPVATIENHNGERDNKLISNVDNNEVFEKVDEEMWQCRNCGHIIVAKKAPLVCPVCSKEQSFFQFYLESH